MLSYTVGTLVSSWEDRCGEGCHDNMGDLSRKLFRACCCVLTRCFERIFCTEHCLPFSCEKDLVCLSFFCVPSTLLLRNALDATSSWLKALQRSNVILSVAPVSTGLFTTTLEHGSGASVLTCGCCWDWRNKWLMVLW